MTKLDALKILVDFWDEDQKPCHDIEYGTVGYIDDIQVTITATDIIENIKINGGLDTSFKQDFLGNDGTIQGYSLEDVEL